MENSEAEKTASKKLGDNIKIDIKYGFDNVDWIEICTGRMWS
jgi:hypothetical protein